MKSSNTWIRICTILCSVLLLALLVFQFMPFWTMPACEDCQVRCELDVNGKCPACAINAGWCVVPTSCICQTKCTSSKTANPDCPICTEKYRLCVAESRLAETDPTADATGETVDPTGATVDTTEPTETAEPIEETVAEEKELVLTPIAPIPADRSGVKVSIQQYIWLPTFESCAGVTEYFETQYEDFKINDIILMPALTVVLTVAMVFFGVLKSKPWASVLALIAGLLTTITYLTEPIFQAGINWQYHLYISIALLVVSLIPTVIGGISLLRKALAKKK